MRHNQNSRRPQRGRNNGHSGGGNHHHNNSSSQQNHRRVNPRIQSFDSNGPEVRIRGTAYQINEKYLTLARDAMSAGDRVLAESYLQHAEHYQRFINEMTEEMNHYNQQHPQQQHHQQQHTHQPQGNGHAVPDGAASPEAAEVEVLNDLDQGFLVGPRHSSPALVNATETAPEAAVVPEGTVATAPVAARPPRKPRAVPPAAPTIVNEE